VVPENADGVRCTVSGDDAISFSNVSTLK
jgi:hypothetical protein